MGGCHSKFGLCSYRPHLSNRSPLDLANGPFTVRCGLRSGHLRHPQHPPCNVARLYAPDSLDVLTRSQNPRLLHETGSNGILAILPCLGFDVTARRSVRDAVPQQREKYSEGLQTSAKCFDKGSAVRLYLPDPNSWRQPNLRPERSRHIGMVT